MTKPPEPVGIRFVEPKSTLIFHSACFFWLSSRPIDKRGVYPSEIRKPFRWKLQIGRRTRHKQNLSISGSRLGKNDIVLIWEVGCTVFTKLVDPVRPMLS
jgi:hypothetical protein